MITLYFGDTAIQKAEPKVLLGDVRFVLSLNPELKDCPRRLGRLLRADEEAILVCLEALRAADEAAA